jgi:DNA polymerase III delta prime subunit
MKPALILYGVPGSGKTTWIKQEAKQRGYRLFRWNVRNDRSLREGREVLHAQVRSQERTLIWIEGADDLTQEAQAFLRRILDTRSPDVICILEARDPSKLSAPVLSRCTLQRLTSETSYRKTMLEGKAVQMGILTKSEETLPTTLEELALYKQQGKETYIWDQATFRNPEIYELLWKHNPYIKGIKSIKLMNQEKLFNKKIY